MKYFVDTFHRDVDERIERELRAFDEFDRVCSTPEQSRAYLIRAGFITEDGQLTERYGGPRQKNISLQTATNDNQ
ncbi:MAG: hypothetical protein LBT53_04920 [Puniceicoccales bacterium]|jgi:hypothetical protein|nr:hypothetical protein [Puniceicoccales bacterium]